MIQGQYRQVNDPNFPTETIKISKETYISDYHSFFFILKPSFDLIL